MVCWLVACGVTYRSGSITIRRTWQQLVQLPEADVHLVARLSNCHLLRLVDSRKLTIAERTCTRLLGFRSSSRKLATHRVCAADQPPADRQRKRLVKRDRCTARVGDRPRQQPEHAVACECLVISANSLDNVGGDDEQLVGEL